MAGDDDRMRTLHELDRSAWSLAAVVSALRGGTTEAEAVLRLLGLDAWAADPDRERLASMAAAPLLQASRFVAGGSSWDAQDDEALLAQGRASAGAVRLLAEAVLPQLPDGDRLASEPARMLDVGVGVAAMAVALCQSMPKLSIVGLDVLARPLELARDHVAAAGLEDAFDLAWLPAPFIPRASLEPGAARVAGALRPGGWLLLGHGRYGDDAWDNAITRFKTVAYGGTPLDDTEAAELLRSAGLADVRRLPTPPGAPALTVGRRAA